MVIRQNEIDLRGEDNKIQLNTKLIFSENFRELRDIRDFDFSDFLDKCAEWAVTYGAKTSSIEITKQALGNARGKWYEWLICLGFWSWALTQNAPKLTLAQLPNINSFDSTKLFKDNIASSINDFKKKLAMSDVNLTTSNPDFVLLIQNPQENSPFDSNQSINAEIETLQELSELYTNFTGKCELRDIFGYLAVKSSMRPDRRLQIAHEGSLFKALSKNMSSTMLSKIYIPKFFAFTTKSTERDRQALKTVATHSIAENDSVPIRAVDEIFDVNNYQDLSQALFRLQSYL